MPTRVPMSADPDICATQGMMSALNPPEKKP